MAVMLVLQVQTIALKTAHMLPLKGFEIVALPMKIAGGSGAPLRIAAKI
ncbi:MAG: hypothetical protein ACKOW8_07260 [Flavobacteriales bacterium]